MNIEDYDIEDFACDHSFQEYCREDNDSSISFWNAWLNEHPEKANMIASARQLVLFLSAGQGYRTEQLSQLQRGLQQRDQLKAQLDSEPEIHNVRKGRLQKYLTALAACFALGAVSYFLITNSPVLSTRIPGHATEYSSTADGRKTVILPDGSLVTLNRNSSISLSSEFSDIKRELTLSGEGFFEVSHDSEHPFLVHTEAVTIKVLGTVFNVSAYPEAQGKTETSLFKGKVEVIENARPDHAHVLQPNEKLVTRSVLNNQLRSMPLRFAILPEQHPDAKPRETAWLRKRLELSNERLEDIAERLEQWYGIEIDFKDEEAKAYRYSGTFENETVLRALEALQLSYPFKIRSENEKIIISK